MEEEAVEAEGGEGGGDEGEGDAELKREDTVLRHRKSTRREKAVEGREEGRMRVVEKFGCRWRQARLANEEGLRIGLGETKERPDGSRRRGNVALTSQLSTLCTMRTKTMKRWRRLC